MSSKCMRRLDRKAMSKALEVVMVAVLILILIGVLIYLNVGGSLKAGVGCIAPGVGKGTCVESQDQCIGIINPIAKGCKGEKPHCCIGEVSDEKDGTGAEPSTEQPPGVAGGDGTPEFSGAMEFHCKCKVEGDYLVPDSNFNKLDIADMKRGNADFKVKKDVELEMQARGTGDVKYCRISTIGKTAGADCAADKGPMIKLKFAQGEHDITLHGHDKKDGTQVASAVIDITAEATSTT